MLGTPVLAEKSQGQKWKPDQMPDWLWILES